MSIMSFDLTPDFNGIVHNQIKGDLTARGTYQSEKWEEDNFICAHGGFSRFDLFVFISIQKRKLLDVTRPLVLLSQELLNLLLRIDLMMHACLLHHQDFISLLSAKKNYLLMSTGICLKAYRNCGNTTIFVRLVE